MALHFNDFRGRLITSHPLTRTLKTSKVYGFGIDKSRFTRVPLDFRTEWMTWRLCLFFFFSFHGFSIILYSFILNLVLNPVVIVLRFFFSS